MHRRFPAATTAEDRPRPHLSLVVLSLLTTAVLGTFLDVRRKRPFWIGCAGGLLAAQLVLAMPTWPTELQVVNNGTLNHELTACTEAV